LVVDEWRYGIKNFTVALDRSLSIPTIVVPHFSAVNLNRPSLHQLKNGRLKGDCCLLQGVTVPGAGLME
jgi:hypothetical protein